ncbi:MAG TPA: hypothetical protein VLF18_12010 [Tahibacter sp.]|uniref:hypothetical protein n=1 Tax=Tahibacter sp. TaxID=2056211 RepID=UPI002C51AAC8|nr:hypothetical protein [Tahibacter sp.]HSX60917.1 hypothetical protein [Tahibacter sp.]
MNTLDLDSLKQRWSAQTRDIDAQLQLDVEAVRRRLTARTATSLARQRSRRGRALVIGGAAFAAIAAFMLNQRSDPTYLLLALPFALLTLAQGSVDLREWLTLQRLDFGMALTQLRAEYDVLRTRRLAMARAIAQLSVLLWLPLVAVVVKVLSGVDLLSRLPLSVTAVNVGLGLLLIPLFAGVVRMLSRRYPDSAALRRFADESAGGDWLRTRDALDRQLEFERDLADDGGRRALHRRLPVAFAPAFESARADARRRAGLGIGLITVLILISGTFNAQHGSDAAALVPGIFQHLLAIGWLIGAILQFDALARPDDGAPGPWRARLQQATRRRGVLLQSYVVAAPLVSLALLQTLGLGLAGVDLWRTLGVAVWLGLGVVATIAMSLLYRRWRRRREGFAAPLVDALSLGCLSRARRAAEAIGDAGDDAHRDAA